MPRYRLIFPPDPGQDVVNAPTDEYESDNVLEVGDTIEHDGRRWKVSSAPIVDPQFDQPADLMVWPADA